MSSPRSKEEWKDLIEPHLPGPLRPVSDEISRTDRVQNWLHDATMEAAEGLGHVSGLQGEMQGYMRMMDALEDQFPDLLEAVDELTEGCGQIDLHWRPMDPNYSRLHIDFGRDFSVKVFARLPDHTSEAARTALESVIEALPDGSPFPNRPNTVTGLVGLDGQCLGVRVKEHLTDDRQQRYRSVTLLPDGQDPIENLSIETACERIAQMLAPANPSR